MYVSDAVMRGRLILITALVNVIVVDIIHVLVNHIHRVIMIGMKLRTVTATGTTEMIDTDWRIKCVPEDAIVQIGRRIHNDAYR